jgi:glycerol uptake facilitator-like aquaporin
MRWHERVLVDFLRLYVGTGLLVATVVGSGIMAAKLAGSNTAVALLGNTIPTGAILVALITIFGPISGADFKPAVSLVMAMRGTLPMRETGPSTIAQLLCGCLGTLAAHAMFALPLLQLSTTARTGGAQWFAEFVAAFGLWATFLGAVRFEPESVPLAVGSYITAAYWFTASTSFANPAVTIARCPIRSPVSIRRMCLASSWRKSRALSPGHRSCNG